MMKESLAQHFLDDALATFRDYKSLAEGGFKQLDDGEFFLAVDREANSIGVIIKHLAGNMRSRWTDFLTTDGEKPDRNRDAEFELTEGLMKEALLEEWERGWSCVFRAVEALVPEDLTRRVKIRGQELTVMQAINRQLTHYAYHVGQIVFLAKHFRSEGWQSLSIPKKSRGASGAKVEDETDAQVIRWKKSF
jgi:hypothetical protein